MLNIHRTFGCLLAYDKSFLDSNGQEIDLDLSTYAGRCDYSTIYAFGSQICLPTGLVDLLKKFQTCPRGSFSQSGATKCTPGDPDRHIPASSRRGGVRGMPGYADA